MITKQITYAGSFAEDGEIKFHEIIRIMEPGVEPEITISPSKTVGVGDDVSGEPQIIRELAAKLHTPARKANRGKWPYTISGVGRERFISFNGEWLEDGQIQVRRIRRTFEDGVQISKKYHRHVVDVGDDVSSESQIVQAIAKGLHTPTRIAARKAFKQQQELDMLTENT